MPQFLYSLSTDEHFMLILHRGCCACCYDKRGVQASFWHIDFIFFECIHCCEIAGACSSSNVNFLRNSTMAHSHPIDSVHRFLFSPHPCQHLVFAFPIITMLAGVRLYLIIVFSLPTIVRFAGTYWPFRYFLLRGMGIQLFFPFV